MKKVKTQPTGVQGTAVATTQATESKLVLLAPVEQTPEELKKEIEKLKRLAYRIPESFEDKIAYFKQKQDWIKNLNKLQGQRDYLLEVQSDIQLEIEQNEFLSENFSFALIRKKGYSGDENIFKVHNPVLVGELVSHVLGKMNDKVTELQISIEA